MSNCKQCYFNFASMVNVTQNMKFVIERIKNIVKKEENVGEKDILLFLHFLDFHYFFRYIRIMDWIVQCFIKKHWFSDF